MKRLQDLRTRVSRTTPGPLLVRGAVFVFGLGALLLALPAEVVRIPAAALVVPVLAVVPALAPRGRLPGAVLFIAVVGWFAATTTYAEPLAPTRVIVLAGLLYLVHTTTALAAVLPYDTVVTPAVLARWLAHTALILAVAAGFGVATLVWVPAAGNGYLAATIAGLFLVGALVGLLATLRRR